MSVPLHIDPHPIEIYRLFSTPIATVEVPGASGFNEALSEYILVRQKHEVSERHSNVGGWQSSPNLCDWDSPEVKSLIDFSRSFVEKLTAINSVQGLTEFTGSWKIEGWANVNFSGCSNALHAHPGAFWSLVYWVDDGRDPLEKNNGGQLEFSDPRGILPAMYSPALRFRIEGCLNAGYTQAITPISGRLIAFPSWLQHSVSTYIGTRPRISISLNFSV